MLSLAIDVEMVESCASPRKKRDFKRSNFKEGHFKNIEFEEFSEIGASRMVPRPVFLEYVEKSPGAHMALRALGMDFENKYFQKSPGDPWEGRHSSRIHQIPYLLHYLFSK